MRQNFEFQVIGLPLKKMKPQQFWKKMVKSEKLAI